MIPRHLLIGVAILLAVDAGHECLRLADAWPGASHRSLSR